MILHHLDHGSTGSYCLLICAPIAIYKYIQSLFSGWTNLPVVSVVSFTIFSILTLCKFFPNLPYSFFAQLSLLICK